MAELNVEDIEELYRLRIADRVTESVDAHIRKRYIWINIAAGLAFVLMSWLGGAALITNWVKAGVDAEIGDSTDEFRAALAAAADKHAEARARLTDLDERLQEIGERQRALGTQIDTARKQAEEAEVKLADIVSSTNTLRKNTDDIDILKATLADLAKLGTTVSQLQSTVVALTQGGAAPSQEVIAAGTRLAEDRSAATIEQRLDTAARSLDQNTVFLQFSGEVTRPSIERLSRALQSIYGYRVPGEERVASNVREVRYFHAEDAKLAAAVADKTSQLLAQQGFGTIEIATTDLQSWSKVNPRPGTVELWLGQLPNPPR